MAFKDLSDNFDQVDEPLVLAGLTPQGCCSVFVIVAYSDGASDFFVIENLCQPGGCGVVQCQDFVTGEITERPATCQDLVDEAINCLDPCDGSDRTTSPIHSILNPYPCLDFDPFGFAESQSTEDYTAQITGWGITNWCGSYFPLKEHPPPPQLCPVGQALDGNGNCVVVDPPVPDLLPNLGEPTSGLNPTLRKGPPTPFAMKGCGCGPDDQTEISVVEAMTMAVPNAPKLNPRGVNPRLLTLRGRGALVAATGLQPAGRGNAPKPNHLRSVPA